ncbi:MAG: DUF1254 domain-containing protein [Chloroflexi bacterium]|nr:DUF1254 domain-containing protein [Chloroflexota bacterium]
MEMTRRVGTSREHVPANAFHHMRCFPNANFRDVVRPNVDTLYSSAWLDLKEEPVILSVPDTKGRYYLMPMMDAWTDVFAVLGPRTTGTASGHFGIVGPHSKGELPTSVERIESPTNLVWIIGRTQTHGMADYANVHPIQDGYQLTPLSQWGKPIASLKSTYDPSVNINTPPVEQVTQMDSATFFETFAACLGNNPPHLNDWPILARMRQIGIAPEKDLKFASLGDDLASALDSAAKSALEQITKRDRRGTRGINGWGVAYDNIGCYGVSYLRRARVAFNGLGAIRPEDAIYAHAFVDGTGNRLHGSQAYILHFDKHEIPPTYAFWSVTLYGENNCFVPNSLNRYALGDRDAMTYNSDSSLDLWIQHDHPGRDKEANWLPAPTGHFSLSIRNYAPRPEVTNGTWKPPPIQRCKPVDDQETNLRMGA